MDDPIEKSEKLEEIIRSIIRSFRYGTKERKFILTGILISSFIGLIQLFDFLPATFKSDVQWLFIPCFNSYYVGCKHYQEKNN